MDKEVEKNDLISPEYCEINRTIYSHAGQSMGGGKHARNAERIMKGFKPKTLLDYGCGQGQFKEAFDLLETGCVVTEYDPCIEGKDDMPEPVDFVTCLDVLEHIEEDKIDEVLKHLFSLAKKGGLLLIAQRLTKVILPDGRNAHILLKNINWWLEKLMPYCTIIECKVGLRKGKEVSDFKIWFKADEKDAT